MLAVDDDLLAKLATTGLDVNNSFVDISTAGNVVSYPLPYLVYHSSLGDDANPRLDGRNRRRSVFFTVMYVGVSPEEAKWAGEKVRAALLGKRVTVAGAKSWLIVLEESQRVRRDDDAIRPDGSPLYYGVDNYAVSITLEGATA